MRRRNINSRKSKKVILVAFEGKNKTENNYFSNYRLRDKDYIIKLVPGNETDPINLVNKTIIKVKELGLNLEENDRAYCIFDTDLDERKNMQIIKARKLAKKYHIIMITSNPCIELWFLLHFEYTTAWLSNNDVINKLKKYYPKYEKNINIFPEIKDKVSEAIKNAKKLESFQLDNNKIIGMVDANPSTEMYKIVEELIMQEKR